MAVDDESEISFFGPSKYIPIATNFCWFYPQLLFITPVASGTAGQADVGFALHLVVDSVMVKYAGKLHT